MKQVNLESDTEDIRLLLEKEEQLHSAQHLK